MKNIKYSNKELGVAFVYLIINLSLFFYGDAMVKEAVTQINMFGSGFIMTYLIIELLESLNDKFIKQGKIPEEMRMEKSRFKFYMLLYGVTSILLLIGEIF